MEHWTITESNAPPPPKTVHWWLRSVSAVNHENDPNQYMHVMDSGIMTNNSDAPPAWINWFGHDCCFSPTDTAGRYLRNPNTVYIGSGYWQDNTKSFNAINLDGTVKTECGYWSTAETIWYQNFSPTIECDGYYLRSPDTKRNLNVPGRDYVKISNSQPDTHWASSNTGYYNHACFSPKKKGRTLSFLPPMLPITDQD